MAQTINPTTLVSVVIPAYNVADYIEQSIFSVVSQTYKELEIIVVDDGSTDATAAIADAYAKQDTRIRIITQSNKGLAAARNTGIANAHGDYVCILDSDDIMLPNKIAEQYAFLDSHPEYNIAYSDLYHFMDGKKSVYHHPIAPLSTPHYESLLYGNVINPNTVFFRRSLFEKYGGFDESIRSAEDWEYWLHVAWNGSTFGYQPIKLTLYRVRNNSLSANAVVMSETPIRVLEKQLLRSVNHHQREIILSRIAFWNKRLYIAYLKKGNKEAAKAIENKIPQSSLFFKLLYLVPAWVLKVRYFIIKKIKFPVYYKRIQDTSVENYLEKVEQRHYQK